MQKVSAEVGSAHALPLIVNATQMSVAIVGLGNEFYIYTVTSLTLDSLCMHCRKYVKFMLYMGQLSELFEPGLDFSV